MAEQAPVRPFEQQAKSAAELASAIEEEYQRILAETSSFDGVVKDDLVKAKGYYEGIESLLRKAEEAWDGNNPVAGKEAYDRAMAELASKDLWRRRLLEFRRAQAESAPTEQWADQATSNLPPGAMPAFERLRAAKKAETDAWASLAEAAVPGATAADIGRAREAALAARSEAEIASWNLAWSRRTEEVCRDKDITGAELDAARKALQEVQEERARLHRERFALEQKVRKTEIDMTAAQNDLFVKYMQAQQAKAQADAAK